MKPTKCQKMASTKDPKKFKPSCKPNGDFQAKQCLPAVMAGAAGTHCWCSLKNGKIIPDTIHSSAKFPKYNCARHAGKMIKFLSMYSNAAYIATCLGASHSKSLEFHLVPLTQCGGTNFKALTVFLFPKIVHLPFF